MNKVEWLHTTFKLRMIAAARAEVGARLCKTLSQVEKDRENDSQGLPLVQSYSAPLCHWLKMSGIDDGHG